jgi:murein L,D-transpeptidase YafK
MKPVSLMRMLMLSGSFALSQESYAYAQMSVNGGMAEFMAATSFAPVVSAPAVTKQLRFSRVREARKDAETTIEQLFKERNLHYPASEIFLRVFKWERTLEVWVRSSTHEDFQLLKSYPICAMAGLPGPKLRRGDGQVPEGFYYIEKFNPISSYHLSLGINYPNNRDRAANTTGEDLGGEIFIHGGCKSAGCLAMTDEGIKELYWMAVTAHASGQDNIPVHIFPMRLAPRTSFARIATLHAANDEIAAFWETLKPGYQFFEETRRLPDIGVDASGRYRINADPGTVARAFAGVAP